VYKELPYKGYGIIFVETEDDITLFHQVIKVVDPFECDYLPDNLLSVWKGKYKGEECYIGKFDLDKTVWDAFEAKGGKGVVLPLGHPYQEASFSVESDFINYLLVDKHNKYTIEQLQQIILEYKNEQVMSKYTSEKECIVARNALESLSKLLPLLLKDGV